LKLFGLFSFFLSSTILLYGSPFADFQSVQMQAFRAFKNKNDIAFKKYLQQQWEKYNAYAGAKEYSTPKPLLEPHTQPSKIVSIGPRVFIQLQKAKKHVKEKEKLFIGNVSIDFFGSKIGFNIDTSIRNANFDPRTKTGIFNFYDALASSDYKGILQRVQDIDKSLHLNDWGVYMLVHKLALKLYDNPDNTVLFSWFMMNRLHYDVRIGYAGKHVVLLVYSKKMIYYKPKYIVNGKSYYVLSQYDQDSLGTLKTYIKSYPGAIKPLSLTLDTLPSFVKNMQKRSVTFSYQGNKYTITYPYNKNLIDFMATYPQANYVTYFDAPMELDTYNAIAKQMQDYLNGKHASEAMNFVLAFVQNAFKYETDKAQFGREKPMFAEETLYYPGSDCEDRSVLYAYLMSKFFGVGVMGVKYANHMATALQIPMQGESFTVDGNRYVIADPTYKNANIGEGMPRYQGVAPSEFIPVQIQ
jgi:hypothetical protein